VRTVWATRGKRTRAEPISQLYEQRRLFHVAPFPDLEEQMCGWNPDSDDSPDRMDALVWGFTELFPASSSIERTPYRPSVEPPVVKHGDLILVGDRYADRS
jgi:phage terminase large subunit-like protein